MSKHGWRETNGEEAVGATYTTTPCMLLVYYPLPLPLLKTAHMTRLTSTTGLTRHGGWAEAVAEAAEAAAAGGRGDGSIVSPPPPEVRVAWRECEQLCSAISKNNETKRKISRRLRNNGRQAERFKADLDGKVRRTKVKSIFRRCVGA